MRPHLEPNNIEIFFLLVVLLYCSPGNSWDSKFTKPYLNFALFILKTVRYTRTYLCTDSPSDIASIYMTSGPTDLDLKGY